MDSPTKKDQSSEGAKERRRRPDQRSRPNSETISATNGSGEEARARTNSESSAAVQGPSSSTNASTRQQDQSNNNAITTGLKTVNRLLTWPMIEVTVSKTNDLYGKFKAHSWVTKFTADATEKALNTATTVTLYVSRPLQAPIGLLDRMADSALNMVEEKLPIVKDEPAVAYERVLEAANPTIYRVTEAVLFTKDKANVVLLTRIGQFSVTQVADRFLGVTDIVLSKIVPNAKPEIVVLPADQDPVMHMLNQVQIIAYKMSRAVLPTATS